METKQKTCLLLGRKLGMTQVYDGDGKMVAVTVIEAGPCPIVRKIVGDNGRYHAAQIAFQECEARSLSKAEACHLRKNGVQGYRFLREFRLSDPSCYSAGDILTVEQFAAGDRVDIAGTTKGRGTQGVVKRYGFAGGPASHGSMFHRRGGSYGCREEPGRVYPGRKMPGRMGNCRRTAEHLLVIRVIPEENLLLVKGSVAGFNGALLEVRPSKKG